MTPSDEGGHVLRAAFARRSWLSRSVKPWFTLVAFVPFLFVAIAAVLSSPEASITDLQRLEAVAHDQVDVASDALEEAQRHEPVSETDWQLVAVAKSELDRRGAALRIATMRLDRARKDRTEWLRGGMIWAMIALFVGFVVFTFVLLALSHRENVVVEVHQHGVLVDGYLVPRLDIVSYLLDGDRLSLLLVNRRQVVIGPAFALGPSLEDVAAAIAQIGLSAEDRRTEHVARANILKQQGQLRARLPE